MQYLYSYLRLLIASTLFMGGIATQFVPSRAAVERDARWRERQVQTVPADRKAEWIQERDFEDSRNEAYIRIFGVLLGGVGLGGALLEAAYLCAQYVRRASPNPP